MFFRLLKSRGLKDYDAYTVARFAHQNRTSLYIALYVKGYDPDILDMRTPKGRRA